MTRAFAGPRAMVAALSIALLAAAGNARADAAEAARWIGEGDCSRAGDEINRGMDANEARAYFLAGYLFDVTGCVEPDPERAANFYRRAAELGEKEGGNFLGLMYALGRGVPQDYALAYRWFTFVSNSKAPREPPDAKKAIVLGYATACTQLARSKVEYPHFARDQGTVRVRFRPGTGEVVFKAGDAATAAEKRVQSDVRFTGAIEQAYALFGRNVEEARGTRPGVRGRSAVGVRTAVTTKA